jgi:hypothetical protein
MRSSICFWIRATGIRKSRRFSLCVETPDPAELIVLTSHSISGRPDESAMRKSGRRLSLLRSSGVTEYLNFSNCFLTFASFSSDSRFTASPSIRHESQRLLFFWPRAAFLRLRTSNGLGRGAPLICSEDPPASVRRCSLNSSRRIAASSSRLFGCVIGQRLSACLAIDLLQQPTSRLSQAQPPKAG